MNEKLSAFVDNELSEIEARRLLTEFGRNENLRGAWGRYHLIRAAMRLELADTTLAALPAAVSAAIAKEPEPNRWRARARALGKTAAGLAIAASVAAIAILSVQSTITPREELAAVNSRAAPVAIEAGPSNEADALNAYLVEHSEFAPTAAMGNLLPYVRTVSHDNNR